MLLDYLYSIRLCYVVCFLFFFFKQKTAYEMRISDWSSDVCSSDLSISAKYYCVDRHDHRSAANRFPKVNRTSAASIEKPIHNVKVPMNAAEAASKSIRRWKLVSSYLERAVRCFLPASGRKSEMVEPIGIEPMTLCFKRKRHPSEPK